MANILYAECEEYLFLNEYMQGNNFGGLLYEDFVEEFIDLNNADYVVWVEQVEESLGLSPSLSPIHHCDINETLNFSIQFGVPIRAYQSSLNVLHTPGPLPLEFCCMTIEVLHGVNIFYEDVWSEYHLVEVSAPVNYIVEVAYDSFAAVMEPYDYTHDVHVSYYLTSNDMANFMHDITQEYYFNCLADDVLGLTLKSSFGYNMFVHSQYRIDTISRNAIGRVADDYILFDDDKAELNWSGQCSAEDVFTCYDSLYQYRGYDFIVASGLGVASVIDSSYYMVHFVSDNLDAGCTAVSPTQRYQSVGDSLLIACKSVIEACFFESTGSEIIIDESTGFAKIGYEPIVDAVSIVEEV